MLFSELSHDFRQKVHSMQLSLAGQDKNGTTETSRALVTISDLRRYLDNFLSMTRMDSITVSAMRSSVEISDLFQSLALQFEDEADNLGIDLRFRYSSLCLHTDKFWLTRVLENLVANALKFGKSKVLVAARARSNGVQFLIMDDGQGMPVSHIDIKKSRSFVRGESAEQHAHGFGLGLTMVYRAVKLIDAGIRIHSRPNVGTLIQIDFARK